MVPFQAVWLWGVVHGTYAHKLIALTPFSDHRSDPLPHNYPVLTGSVPSWNLDYPWLNDAIKNEKQRKRESSSKREMWGFSRLKCVYEKIRGIHLVRVKESATRREILVCRRRFCVGWEIRQLRWKRKQPRRRSKVLYLIQNQRRKK